MKLNIALISILAAGSALAGTASTGKAPKGPAPISPPPPTCDIAYNYIQAFYEHGEFDVPGVDSSDGFNVQLSYSPADNFFVTGGFGYAEIEGPNFSEESWGVHTGVGGYIQICPAFHLGAEVGVVGDITEGDDEWAVYGKPHLRLCAGPIEFKTGVEINSFDVDGDNWMIQHELLFKTSMNVDLALAFDWNNDVQFYNAGLRYRF